MSALHEPLVHDDKRRAIPVFLTLLGSGNFLLQWTSNIAVAVHFLAALVANPFPASIPSAEASTCTSRRLSPVVLVRGVPDGQGET